MFEQAVRMKLRFATTSGVIGVEDLWDMSLRRLDTLFKSLNALKKTTSEESLLDEMTAEDEVLSMKIGIVKRIVSVKIADAKSRESAEGKKDRKEQLMGVLVRKQNAALEELTPDQITAMIDDL